jgi:hypothetical protein
MAERQLLQLEKSRRRDPHAPDFGGWMVKDDTNTALLGATPTAYSATLDEVESFLTDESRPHFRKGRDGEYRWTIPETAAENVSPLEVMLWVTTLAMKDGDRARALKHAKDAAPYMGLTAQQIVEEVVAGKSVSQMYAEVQEKLRMAASRRM